MPSKNWDYFSPRRLPAAFIADGSAAAWRARFALVLWPALALAVSLVGGPQTARGQAPASQFPDYRQLPPEAYRPGRIILFPKPGREADLERFHETARAKVRRRYPPAFRRMQIVDLPAEADTLVTVEAYQRSGLVDSADPNITLQLAALPNDPAVLNGTQWPLHNLGAGGGTPDADIDAPEAWDQFNSATNVIVAVIDSGARYTHQDLAANMWVNPGEIPGNDLDDDENGYVDDIHGINAVIPSGQPSDEIGHGTHVSGIIGAVGNNGFGTSGVAWQARIMACRFLNPGQDGTLADLSDCVYYAINKGAKVMNCSFTTPVYTSGMSNMFLAVRDAGIVVAAAAGNGGTDNDSFPIYPASLKLDNIVSVTATTKADTFSGYNFGATSVHLGAPGSGIVSTYNRSDTDSEFLSGTSMAAPHVAGALALLRARYPQLTHQQIITRLLASVDPLPGLAGRCLTGGRLNLNLAIGAPRYAIVSAPFAWVPTNGLSPLTLAADGVSAAVPLPFPFPFFGRAQSHVYLSANGIAGFENVGLAQPVNSALPALSEPNDAIYPYWDDLNPAGGGRVWMASQGLVPNRRFVVSWVGLPHSQTSGGETLLTFQLILHETGEIAFQYLDVQGGRSTVNSGRSASVGIEDSFGHLATRYAVNGIPAIVTNQQAILIAPQLPELTGPSLRLSRVDGGGVTVTTWAQPGRRCVIRTSADLQAWTALSTNIIPASGVLAATHPTSGLHRFFQARLDP